MNRSDVTRIFIVAGLLAPLVWLQSGPGFAPNWLSARWGAVPLSVCATVVWFIAMMLLTWRFARSVEREKS